VEGKGQLCKTYPLHCSFHSPLITLLQYTACTYYSIQPVHITVYSLYTLQYTAFTHYSTQPVHITVHSLYTLQYTACTYYSTQPVHITVHSLYTLQYTACTHYSTQPVHITLHSLYTPTGSDVSVCTECHTSLSRSGNCKYELIVAGTSYQTTEQSCACILYFVDRASWTGLYNNQHSAPVH
jgi:hypothetical protein